MADHMSAYIEIGGYLPAGKLSYVAQQFARQGGPDWGAYYVSDQHRVQSDLKTASSQVRVFLLYDEEAPWGQFEDVESICRELDLSYRRHCCAKYEHDAMWHWWQPAMNEPDCCSASQEGAVLIGADELREQIQVAKLEAQRFTPSEVAVDSLASRLEGWINARTPPDIPPLEIIKDQ